MSSALPDIAASAPRAPLPPPLDAAGIRRRVGRWLGRLTQIGVVLGTRLGSLAACRRASGLDPAPATVPKGSIDLILGWALVRRAMRWVDALRARLAAEAAMEGPGMERPENLLGDLFSDLYGNRRAPASRQSPPDDCIEGLSAAVVVGQICADLDAAATMLRDASAAREIAAIAAAARALLGGPAETWTPLPLSVTPDGAADEVPPATMRAVAMPAPVPDTG